MLNNKIRGLTQCTCSFSRYHRIFYKLERAVKLLIAIDGLAASYGRDGGAYYI
jgi:hypothetical protein